MRKKTRLKLSNISLLPYLLYCNIDLNLLHNYCCHHISRNDFVQLFKCTFQKKQKNTCLLSALFKKTKMKKIRKKCLSFKKSSLLSAQKCMDFDGQPRLPCNTEWCHNHYETSMSLVIFDPLPPHTVCTGF